MSSSRCLFLPGEGAKKPDWMMPPRKPNVSAASLIGERIFVSYDE
jgi:hypothetical protein